MDSSHQFLLNDVPWDLDLDWNYYLLFEFNVFIVVGSYTDYFFNQHLNSDLFALYHHSWRLLDDLDCGFLDYLGVSNHDLSDDLFWDLDSWVDISWNFNLNDSFNHNRNFNSPFNLNYSILEHTFLHDLFDNLLYLHDLLDNTRN